MKRKLKSLREALKPVKETLQQEEDKAARQAGEEKAAEKERLQREADFINKKRAAEKERLQREAAEASRRYAAFVREALEDKAARQADFINKKRAAEKERLQREAAEEKAAEAARLKLAEQRAAKEKVEEEEFRQLVEEMSPHGFTHSRQVSLYIRRNKLGYKYKHISGILEMELDGNIWDFDGGFPTDIFARLCGELGLKSQGSRATPRKFTPYKDIL